MLSGSSRGIPVVLTFLLLPSRFSIDVVPSEYQEMLFPAEYPEEFENLGSIQGSLWISPASIQGSSWIYQGSQNAS